jgi:hypothetical protein
MIRTEYGTDSYQSVDPDPGRRKFPPQKEKIRNFMLKEFSVELEPSLGA